uniref:F-box domain-containing protein n=1 Tax=Panagrolaimus sp. ES5 TaxID=591445 RepID=A0AC34G5H1_9BILA
MFSLPESIIFYMAMNPLSSEFHQNLLQCCKYFFIKNSIINYHCLLFDDNDGWKTCFNDSCYLEEREYRKIELNLDTIHSRIRIWDVLKICSSNSSMATSLISKLYNGDFTCLRLKNQKISFNQLLLFSPNVRSLILVKCSVFYENGDEVPGETVLKNFTNLEAFTFFLCPDTVVNCSNTAKELLQIPQFKTLGLFTFKGLSEAFDIDTFFNQYLKGNKITRVALLFTNSIPEAYKEKLQAITDEILDDESPRPYYIPHIHFDGQLRQDEIANLFFGLTE